MTLSLPPAVRRFALIISALCLCSFAVAADLETKLTSARVTGTGDTENFVDAATAAPGDTIRYVATYTNTSKRALREVAATLPIPQNLELVLSSVKPVATDGSTDGKTFVPLSRLLKPKSEGGMGILPSAVRALRWAPRDLPAAESFSVEARAKISSAPAKR